MKKNNYSVAVIENNEIKMILMNDRYGVKPKLIIAPGKCRYEFKYYRGIGIKIDNSCFKRIYIPSIRSLQTSGWNHGKFGKGKTNIIYTNQPIK